LELHFFQTAIHRADLVLQTVDAEEQFGRIPASLAATTKELGRGWPSSTHHHKHGEKKSFERMLSQHGLGLFACILNSRM
jgi:hypothetical protein